MPVATIGLVEGVRVPTLAVLEKRSEGGHGPDAIVDGPHPHAAARAKFSRPGPFPVGALVWRAGSGAPSTAPLTFQLTEHVGWLAADAASADPREVVKQVSFLHKSSTVGIDEFRAHYRHHVEVARRHMPTLWQYVQYDVVGIDGHDPALVSAATGIVAVSVLWFRSTGDFLDRYFASPEDEAQFRSQEGFLDLAKAFTFVAGGEAGAPPAARP
jgi:hypothetical protein